MPAHRITEQFGFCFQPFAALRADRHPLRDQLREEHDQLHHPHVLPGARQPTGHHGTSGPEVPVRAGARDPLPDRTVDRLPVSTPGRTERTPDALESGTRQETGTDLRRNPSDSRRLRRALGV